MRTYPEAARPRGWRLAGPAVLSLVAVGAAIVASGCSTMAMPLSAEARAGVEECGGADCHDTALGAQSEGGHAGLGCVVCHEGADGDHAADPKAVEAAVDWRIDSCAPCHQGEAATYLYDDNAQAGPFGGSIREPAQPKKATFPLYSVITSGHAFNKEYNEEGAHAWMLADHRDITRGKYETCMQCKSTRIAWSWTYGKPMTVAKDANVVLTHTKTPATAAKSVKIPKGTVLTVGTDPKTREVDAKAVTPDGKTYTSRPAKSDDATANFDFLWATTVALTEPEMPYGAGCNHCHDPHSTEPRIVRGAMLAAIENGGPDGKGGLNPYGGPAERVKTLEAGSHRDVNNSLCGQCHVEYTCGKSGVDGKDRDAFGWGKAGDLHEMYDARYGYAQDWRHKMIGEPLIKSQHPELEQYWGSTHYKAGASCADCHMPKVRDTNGKEFRSHWLTSPYKYHDAKLTAAFSAATGVRTGSVATPCDACHANRVAAGIAIQRSVFAEQAKASAALAASARALAAAKAAGNADTKGFAEALDKHRRAHVLWENLIVSENSMGFHNPDEVLAAMAESTKLANEAAKQAAAAK